MRTGSGLCSHLALCRLKHLGKGMAESQAESNEERMTFSPQKHTRAPCTEPDIQLQRFPGPLDHQSLDCRP